MNAYHPTSVGKLYMWIFVFSNDYFTYCIECNGMRDGKILKIPRGMSNNVLRSYYSRLFQSVIFSFAKGVILSEQMHYCPCWYDVGTIV